MYIVDTSVWIDFLDGTENQQVEHFEILLETETPIFYTGLILQEVLQGFHSNKQKTTIKNEFRKLLLINPTIEDHLRASDIFTLCRSKGFVIRKSIDCLIASLALQYNLRLLDRDKDFRHISKCIDLDRFDPA